MNEKQHPEIDMLREAFRDAQRLRVEQSAAAARKTVLIERLHAKGLSYDAIGKIVDMHASAIANHVYRYGASRSRKGAK